MDENETYWDKTVMEALVDSYPLRELPDIEEVRFKWGEGIEWAARLDMTTQEIVMQATIPNKSYLAIGFGENMRGTDMIVWRWKDVLTEVDNLYSSGYGTPPSDGTNFLQTTVTNSNDGRFKTFTTRRAFDTGDAKDFVV